MPSTMLNIIDLIKDYRRVVNNNDNNYNDINNDTNIKKKKKWFLIIYVLNDVQACGEEQPGHLLPLHPLPVLDDARLCGGAWLYIPGKGSL